MPYSTTALKTLCAPIFTPTLTNPPIFHCFHSFAFSEFHGAGMVPHVAFSEWLLSLNNMHLEFFHVHLAESKALVKAGIRVPLSGVCLSCPPSSASQPIQSTSTRGSLAGSSEFPAHRATWDISHNQPSIAFPGNLHRASF